MFFLRFIMFYHGFPWFCHGFPIERRRLRGAEVCSQVAAGCVTGETCPAGAVAA